MAFDPRLRSPKEQPLFVIGVVLSSLVWLVMIVSIIGLLYGGLVFVGVLMAHALYLAHVRGNGVRVSEQQLPGLYERVRLASSRLGLDTVPDVYVMQAGGTLNAFATKLFSRRFVVIYSDLVDNCHDVRHLDFVVGHEIAHLAAGHLRWNAFLLPFHLVPWLGAAYSRAREYTCDRGGHYVTGDLEASMRGLCVLAAGGKLTAQMNLQAFVDQRHETGGFWMSIYELVASHPYLCKRVAALVELERPGTVQPVPRSVAGTVLAPMLGVAAGGPYAIAVIIVFYMGIIAAAAIPSFIKAQEEAKAAAATVAAQAADDADDYAPVADDADAGDEEEVE